MKSSSPYPASIILSGWYGVNNAGDEAILQQFIKEMVEPGLTQLTILTERPQRVEECYGGPVIKAVTHDRLLGRGLLKSILNGGLRRHIRMLRSASLFVLGGGGILRDNNSLYNVAQILDEIWLKKLMGGKTALYAVGAGPFCSRTGKWLIRRTVAACDLVTVRDEGSKKALTEIGVPADRIRVVADPALLLAPTPIRDTELRNRLTSLAGVPRTVGVFLEEDYTPVLDMAKALDTLHSKHGFRFIGLPMRCHADADDREMARRVRASMQYPDALQSIETPLAPAELKWTAAQFAMNITVRLHALVFSLSMETPAIAVNYEPKVAHFLNSFGLDDWRVDTTPDAAADIVAKTLALYSDLSGAHQRITRKLQEQRHRAGETFTLLRQLLKGVAPSAGSVQAEAAGRISAALPRDS